MSKIFAGLLAGFFSIYAMGFALPVIAADKGGAYVPPVFDEEEVAGGKGAWYIGATAGINSSQVSAAGIDLGENGIIGGIFAGYNYRMKSGWVLGVEADVDWSNVDMSFAPASFEPDYTWSARIRTGPTIGNNVLVYATAGVAGTSLDLKGAGASLDETYLGWVAGAGADIDLGERWFLRAEGLYYDFGGEIFAPGTPSVDATRTVYRLGVGYKF